MSENSVFIGGGGAEYAEPQSLLLKYANRHGLIAGATGTGKTVTLQILAESFSAAGVPVFLADVKGDLSGLAQPGSPDHKLHDKLVARAQTIGFDGYGYDAFPVVFWDLFGAQGHPIRTTVTEMGPLLLARMLDLNDTQEGVLTIAFRVAEDEGLALLDLKDLRAMLVFLGENRREIGLEYGNISTASIGAIQRRLLVLEQQGAERFFGEPALALSDMIACTQDGRGRINLLAADKLMQAPRLYATFLLWLLSELWEELPEVGDPDKPKFVFFFDEAHLLFDDAPKVLLDKVEQVARLIRSKGVGVYFITQNPADVPDDILGQLGNRVQHALRAYTPRDRKALRAAAETFRQNPAFDTEKAIRAVGIGEALVSTLEAKGTPSMVQRTLIRPPSSHLGPCDPAQREAVRAASPLAGLYDETVDRESAYERLKKRGERRMAAEAAHEEEDGFSHARRYRPGDDDSAPRRSKTRRRRSDSVGEAVMKSVLRSAGTQLGRGVVKSLLRGLFR
ncbi:MAG: helicase HerA-like domain-containing protein [Pseudomonadota bacterium]